jgi:hypothetical protein
MEIQKDCKYLFCSQGGNGGDGSNGTPGGHGERGADAQHASNVELILSGFQDNRTLSISGPSYNGILDMGSIDEAIILVNGIIQLLLFQF